MIDQTTNLAYTKNMKKTVAKVLVENKAGLYLLLQRGDTHPNFPGHPDLPGGEVESGETIKEAASRELLEEIGISIAPDKLEEVFTKERTNVKRVLFLLSIDSSNTEVKLSREHKSYKWLTRDEIVSIKAPNDADPYYLDFLE